MMTKTAYYMQMAQEAAAQITGSKEQWTAFLTTSARLYKYPFAEQLMIYKQRPEATACAEYDLWNDRMNRYVKRGSKGIALLDMRGEQPKLRYVFDVADTGERKNSRPVQLWKMNAEHEQPIIRALDAAFDVSAGAGSLENHIMEAAERLARDYWEENRRQISDIVADSYLEGYDELNIGASFKRAAAVSIAYSVFTRTVGNADDYFEHEDFLDIFDFNTQAAANVLGTAVSEMSSQIFREIERTIRTYERDKQAERSQNYDGAELHEERRLPDSGHPVVGAGTEAPGQVREDAQSVSAGEQHAAVQSPDPDREAVPAPVGDSGDRDRTDGADDGGSSESESGTGQEIEPDGLGAAHEHAESAGRGSHSDGTYQQLNFMSLFQSEAEQIQKIDAAAENAAKEAESEKPSAFVISEDEIDRMLRTGSNFEGGKIRIYALYQQQGDAKERAAFLKAEYGLGGHSYTFMDGSRGFADYNGRGILLRNYDHEANTEVRKKELFSKVRTGQVRVLLGSTAKMGAGTNVQDRLVALHDLDCPWRPGDLAQRKGRIERQGNQNPLVHVYRYVTEGTFDAYLWQTVENKQKFISQIMTSKSPVRSCDDVDETALSFAEIKALCAGDPRIKERMDLDVEVSRLKLMKADHQSKQYRLEDQLLKYFPEEIEKHKGFIKGFESDLEVLTAHPHPEDGFAGMEIRGDLLTDKENAGAALLDACKEVKTSDSVQIGSYRGFTMLVEFEAWKQEYTLLLKGQMTHRATLGTDPRGNLTRIDNALAQMPQRLEAVKNQLENLYQQQVAAKEEVGKPFLYEEELRSKNARLVELDTLLNIDRKGQAHTESVVAKSTRPSVLDNLKRPVQPRSTDKKPKQHEEVR